LVAGKGKLRSAAASSEDKLAMAQSGNELPAAYAIAHANSRFKRGVAGLRDKWSNIERELLRKIVEDPRFAEGPAFCVEHL
jgi:hypothetical protein